MSNFSEENNFNHINVVNQYSKSEVKTPASKLSVNPNSKTPFNTEHKFTSYYGDFKSEEEYFEFLNTLIEEQTSNEPFNNLENEQDNEVDGNYQEVDPTQIDPEIMKLYDKEFVNPDTIYSEEELYQMKSKYGNNLANFGGIFNQICQDNPSIFSFGNNNS